MALLSAIVIIGIILGSAAKYWQNISLLANEIASVHSSSGKKRSSR